MSDLISHFRFSQIISEMLEWRDDEFGRPERTLYLAGLYIGEVHECPDINHNPRWRAWFSGECEGSSRGLFVTADTAKNKVIQTFKEECLDKLMTKVLAYGDEDD